MILRKNRCRLVGIDPLHRHAPFRIGHHGKNLPFHQGFRRGKGILLQQPVHHGNPHISIGLLRFLGLYLNPQIRLQFFKTVEFLEILDKFLVNLGKPLLFDVLELHREYDLLARHRLVVVTIGKCYGEFLAFPLLHPHQLILETGDEALRTDLQEIIVGFHFLQRLAVQDALKIDDDVPALCDLRLLVGFLHRAVHLLQFG